MLLVFIAPHHVAFSSLLSPCLSIFFHPPPRFPPFPSSPPLLSDELRLWAFLSETYFFFLHVVVAMVIVPVLTGYLIQTFLVSWLQVEVEERERRITNRRDARERRDQCIGGLRSAARFLPRLCCPGAAAADADAIAFRALTGGTGHNAIDVDLAQAKRRRNLQRENEAQEEKQENQYTLHMRERMGDFNFALFGGHLAKMREEEAQQLALEAAEREEIAASRAPAAGEGGEVGDDERRSNYASLGAENSSTSLDTNRSGGIGDSSAGFAAATGASSAAAEEVHLIRRALKRAHEALRLNGFEVTAADAAIAVASSSLSSRGGVGGGRRTGGGRQRNRRASHSRSSSRKCVLFCCVVVDGCDPPFDRSLFSLLNLLCLSSLFISLVSLWYSLIAIQHKPFQQLAHNAVLRPSPRAGDGPASDTAFSTSTMDIIDA